VAKAKTRYVCQQCGSAQPKWLGRCPDCGEWNSLVETVVESQRPGGGAADVVQSLLTPSQPQPLSAITAERTDRVSLPMNEFNRVLGGGLVPGSLVLIGGDPGIGKSTLLLQMSVVLTERIGTVLYISGEESATQIKIRADRLGLGSEQLMLLTETNMSAVLGHIERLRPGLTIIDSIQTMYMSELASAPGSVSQVRESAARFQEVAKGLGVAVFLIGHVTKTGAIAGPRVLEHIVDTVLYLEGERYQAYRLLRCVKNRFGATNEVGVFEMSDQGLTEVPNPSEVFLAERLPNSAGSSIAVTIEGTRPILIEVQALTSLTSFGNPRRTSNGIDMNRLLLLIAVLSKRVGLRLSDQDVFVNVIGGLRVGEPASDLAVATAIASSFRDVPLVADLAMVGEVGLSGELRAVSHLETRLKEAAKLGFRRCLVPSSSQKQSLNIPNLKLIPRRSLAEALESAFVR
jgi:DNA repair protein RadA/Sms